MAAPSRWTCPSEDTLFRFSTGDASRWQRARLQRHLDRCAACAARLDGWEAATSVYREFVNRDGDSEERARLARFEARLRREPMSPPPAALAWSRQVLSLRPIGIGWRSIAAAVVIVAGGLFGFLPLQETITADALVARAVANDRQCPCPRADMVTIVASPQRGSAHTHAGGAPAHRVALSGGSTEMSRDESALRDLMSERGAHARELAERLAEYAFDWQVPLSARPYQEWRAAITARTESYDWIASDRVRVSTQAASGRIERAELILRTTDYRPVGQTWQFADGFAVELRLFERETPAVPSPTLPALNRIAAASGAPAATATRTIEETEIALRVSLERAGVVMTRRLTLRNNGERLTIAGRAARRDVPRIAASAQEIGGISVEVRGEARRPAADPAGVRDAVVSSDSGLATGSLPNDSAPADSASNGIASNGSAATGFNAWLDRTFGASPSHAAFLPTAQELCDDFADAVAALDGLSRRFPASAADPRLSARARDDVHWLAAAYYSRATASYERLEAHLAPLTGTVSRRVLPAAPPSHWRTTSVAIAPALRELSAELAGLASPASPPSSPSPASSALPSSASPSNATADDFERTTGVSLREKLVAVVPR
jgi:hypothetical protein